MVGWRARKVIRIANLLKVKVLVILVFSVPQSLTIVHLVLIPHTRSPQMADQTTNLKTVEGVDLRLLNPEFSSNET